ncbi:xanthine dehydrogenase family protein molybdopterin-binding subunit [Methylobacterium sp. WL30]|uniref:xanthine dehydrogenase family protein molybdopterin-binding subunit n=1 Tax=unclassified Methylobacterium TaxID=2615210 RepID=UPI0011C9A888|nr:MULTISPECIES: xanthine dehydrogenase family protein molybdopterin-binding subunit [unclassified Methylobacterium]MCJ2114073.1 xanthine dehydrogenase family protein molybdopterin-binding subunit [Methylobacterium sp. E-025]TXM92140.1 xanthine dehydrogenase family protein molybdopterin-binding subunit [Methylobacterium sp. WL116]TXN36486.1 xanthine dehydrogenase family protein molybdopterin-binding subunit [Methylobacterium sp. WL93]TXN49701.1 xanthine dehydrogenase family protein molybdopteri
MTQTFSSTGRDTFVGSARSRVDGPAKVTGLAKYAGEFAAPDLLHGYVVSSGIAKGRIRTIDTGKAEAVPGVVKVLTHENRTRTAWLDYNYQDQVAPPGSPFRALYDDKIHYSGQPIALVLAEDFETARHAAALVAVDYEVEEPLTDLEAANAFAYEPPMRRNGIKPPPKPWGDADAAFDASAIQLKQEYRLATEHHNPMEPHASTVIFEGDGKYTVYDKVQGVSNSHAYLAKVFGIAKDDLRVLNPYLGGGFGSGLRPQYQLFLAMLAARDLERSVRVVLTRDQMWSITYRPEALQTISLGAERDGTLLALRHDAVGATSTFEDYQEVVVNWSGVMYRCDNVLLTYKIAKLDTYTPGDMRAPGAVTGVFAIETAMDELAYASGLDPIQLRLKNFTEADATAENKPFGSKALKSCFSEGAARFGWDRRNPEPRSMREGRELVGWGMASGVWESMMMQTSARAILTPDGKLEVGNSTGDIGTGTYTILTQIAADTLGLTMEDVTTKLGDTALPEAPVAGGSWTAASSGTAVMKACRDVGEQVFKLARQMEDSPLANVDFERVAFADGCIAVAGDPARSVALVDVLRASGVDKVEATANAAPDKDFNAKYEAYTHSAIFVEVKVDEELGQVRVTRVVSAIAAGKVLNPKTARSQILGGVVMGIGSALEEESMMDDRIGRFMNHNLGEYHVPVNADIHDIDVIFVDEEDKANPLGVKGLGEIGIVGTAAAVANAVFHATGKRIRNLPITVDKILG